MGDDVKITVIATGFRRDMPERRERLLTAVLREPASHRVPVETRVETPRFMSEDEDPEPARRVIPVSAVPVASPVPVSVAAVPVQEPVYAPEPERIAEPEPVAVAVAEPVRHADVFGQVHEEEQGENLDIPAFMRRGGL
jgi:cell division protein FtsZ